MDKEKVLEYINSRKKEWMKEIRKAEKNSAISSLLYWGAKFNECLAIEEFIEKDGDLWK